MTTTATATIDITCPHWCTWNPQQHADDIWNNSGCVIHSSRAVVSDHQGYSTPLEDPRFNSGVVVGYSIETTPDGRYQATPTLWLEGQLTDISPNQALNLAHTLVLAVLEAAQPPAGKRPEEWAAADKSLVRLARQLSRVAEKFATVAPADREEPW